MTTIEKTKWEVPVCSLMGRERILTKFQKAQIYKKYQQFPDLTQKELAEEYDISQALVSQTVNEMRREFDSQIDLIKFIESQNEMVSESN
jgi:predicted DNA-binding protein YlxM (UPF0122 family)